MTGYFLQPGFPHRFTAAWVHITRYNGGLFYERSGPGPSGKTRKETMIRKKWRDGEPVLSVETEDEFWKALVDR